MKEKIEVIRALSSDLDTALTIREISKRLKKSYGFANKICWELINEGVINKKEIGASILCSLNYKNEVSIGLLILSSIYKSKELVEKYSHVIGEVKKSNGCIFEYNNKLYSFGRGFVSSEEVVIVEDIIVWLTGKKLSDVNVIYGYETFWRMIANVK